jgi:hypothetical protein
MEVNIPLSLCHILWNSLQQGRRFVSRCPVTDSNNFLCFLTHVFTGRRLSHIYIIVGVKVTLRQMVHQQVCLVVKHPIWGSWPDFYYCQTVAVLPIWAPSMMRARVYYNFWWNSPVHSFSRSSPMGFMHIVYCLRFGTSPTAGPVLRTCTAAQLHPQILGSF